MLSKIILASYKVFLEVGLWVTLAASLIGGWTFGGFWAGIGALAGGFVFCVIVFGAFLVLSDIQRSVSAIKERAADHSGSIAADH